MGNWGCTSSTGLIIFLFRVSEISAVVLMELNLR